MASTNSIALGTFHSVTLQLPVENITFRQLDLKEPTNYIADVSVTDAQVSDTDAQVSDTEEDLSSVFEKIKDAWKQPNKKESIFNVCENTKVERLISFYLIKKDL